MYQIDGSPNGYHVFKFEGAKYSERFKAASHDPEYQMRISRPAGNIPREEMKDARVIVNVFDGSRRSLVEYRLDDSPPVKMEMNWDFKKDPFIEDLAEQYEGYRLYPWEKGTLIHHMWTAPLPKDLAPGLHTIVVRTVDQFGHTYQAARIFLIE